MKHKKLIGFILLLLIIYFIYISFHDNKVNYLSIGDSLAVGVNAYNERSYGYSDYLANYLKDKNLLKNYSKDFANANFRITDLQHQLDINQVINKYNKSLSFKKCLREADLVTISIGINDILTEINMSTSDIDVMEQDKILEIFADRMVDFEKLIKDIRKYNTKEIIVLGYYNPYEYKKIIPDRIFSYFDKKMEGITEKYDIKFISLFQLFKNNGDYLPNPTNIHPSTLGYEAIYKQIVRQLDQKKLAFH